MPRSPIRVAVVAEYYPRAADPVLGVWAHRQALAAREAGADVRVLALHRPVPPRAALRARDRRALAAPLRQPRRALIDGIPVAYVPFAAPPRWRSYGSWGAWAAPTLAIALRRLHAAWPFDLVHAHYAAPAGDAVRRARTGTPYIVSVHGGDVLGEWARAGAGLHAVERGLRGARLVLANSAGIERRARARGAREVRVVHLGTDLPAEATTARAAPPVIATVGHLVPRKRHADVIRAIWLLRDRHPLLRYSIVGDGPSAGDLAALAARLGVADRVDFRGALPPAAAAAAGRAAWLFAMPSVDEALGIAYLEAMAGGTPAIGCIGEPGPEDIAAAGWGIRLVPPADIEALAAEIDGLLRDERARREAGRRARETVSRAFTWDLCGRATVEAYRLAAAGGGSPPRA
ncbi:MAG: glycosyltransferase [Solirubrobacteraceae bacterium]